MQEALCCRPGGPVGCLCSSNTCLELKHCHNTAQHFTTPNASQPCSALQPQHCSTPLKPSAQQPTGLLLHHLHPLVPPLQFQFQEPHIVAKHGRISAFQRSTFQTSLPIPSVSSHNSQTPLQQIQTHFHPGVSANTEGGLAALMPNLEPKPWQGVVNAKRGQTPHTCH